MGRETLLQFETFENGAWQRYVRRERQYTYDTQTESIPTVETHYNDFNATWTPFSKEERTFRADRYVDTLYDYSSPTGHIDGFTIPSFFAYRYNDHGNLVQAHKHYFLQDGQEINGYRINYFYEDYDDDPTTIGKQAKNLLDLKIYPNPAKAQLHLSVSGTNAPLILRVTDLGGLCRIRQKVNPMESSLDIRHLAPGIYFLTLMDERSGDYKTSRFVKQ